MMTTAPAGLTWKKRGVGTGLRPSDLPGVRAVVLALLISTLFSASAYGQGSGAVVLRELVLDASAILSADEIQRLQAEFAGALLTDQTVEAILSRINGLYAEKGYLAQALILPQTIENGRLAVTLVEARIGRIDVEGNRTTRASYLTERLRLGEGDLVHLGLLDEAITQFNMTNDVAVRVELRPGEDFGESDLVLHVQEPANSRFVLAVDGAGRAESGQYRTSLTWRIPSLTWHRDPLSVATMQSEGVRSTSVNYSYPVSPSGARLGAQYSWSLVEFLDANYGPVGLKVQSKSGGITLSRPFEVKAGFMALGSVELQVRESKTYLSGTQLTGSEGQALVLGLSMEGAEEWGSWSFNHGVRAGVARTPNASDVWFGKYTASLQLTRATGPRSRWVLRGTWQHTNDKLLPSDEQFHVGGDSTVRGYRQGFISGDRGYVINVEYHWPVSPSIGGYVFVDHGGVVPYKGNNEPITHEEFATSVGMGLNWQLTPWMFLHLVYGAPVGPGAESLPAILQFRLQAVY